MIKYECFFHELGINNFPFLQVEFFNLGGVKVLAEVCLFLVLIMNSTSIIYQQQHNNNISWFISEYEPRVTS